MTRTELFSLMSCGMATIAGTVMVLYAGILQNSIPCVMGHILTASIISVPASVTIAKIMIPETGEVTSDKMEFPEQASSAMDAVTKGTMQGISLLINILAMLIVLVIGSGLRLTFTLCSQRSTGVLTLWSNPSERVAVRLHLSYYSLRHEFTLQWYSSLNFALFLKRTWTNKKIFRKKNLF